MRICFQIGPMSLQVDTPQDFPWTPEAARFRVDSLTADTESMHYTLEFTDSFAPLWGTVLYRDPLLQIMDVQGQECRIHMLSGSGEPFALSRRVDEANVHLLIDQRARRALKWDRTLLGLFTLEHDCLALQGFLLHASYIIHDGRAIVFTAPSGTGKSTQADLWASHAGAQIINGDRTLLFRKDGQWYAGGFPVCGSSSHCLNRTAPLEAVICLAKAPRNRALRPHPLRAMKMVYSQAFVNHWNPEDCRRISDLIIDLVQLVPTFHYECTKEADAVADLKSAIDAARTESR